MSISIKIMLTSLIALLLFWSLADAAKGLSRRVHGIAVVGWFLALTVNVASAMIYIWSL